MSPLEAALEDYLRLRRALGHKLDDSGRQLTRFVTYLDFIGAETVTMQAALEFVLDADLDPGSTIPARRLTAVRGFARYLAGLDGAAEVPPAGLVSSRARHRVPHIFSDEDVAAVIRHARASTPFPFRQATLATMIGLLAVTGMRVGEAIRLGRADVELGRRGDPGAGHQVRQGPRRAGIRLDDRGTRGLRPRPRPGPARHDPPVRLARRDARSPTATSARHSAPPSRQPGSAPAPGYSRASMI